MTENGGDADHRDVLFLLDEIERLQNCLDQAEEEVEILRPYAPREALMRIRKKKP